MRQVVHTVEETLRRGAKTIWNKKSVALKFDLSSSVIGGSNQPSNKTSTVSDAVVRLKSAVVLS